MKGIAVLFAIILGVVSASFQEIDLSSSAGNQWTLRECNASPSDVIPGQVPGNVHTDLMNAKKLLGDPYYRYNELNMSWVTQQCWLYELTVDASKWTQLALDSSEPWHLHFAGLDTLATVMVNNVEIGASSNAFRSYFFPGHSNALTSKKELTISVRLDSVISEVKRRANAYPYPVPATENWNVWVEPSSRNFIRKAGSDFGWDWGPAYVPAGITHPVSLIKGSTGKLDGLVVKQDIQRFYQRNEEKNAELVADVVLDVFVHVSAATEAYNAKAEIFVDSVLQQINDISIPASLDPLATGASSPYRSANEIVLDPQLVSVGVVKLTAAKLWWPRGHGGQPRYDVSVKLTPKVQSSMIGKGVRGSYGSLSSQQLSRRIGIRSVELVSEEYDSNGLNVGTKAFTSTPRSIGRRNKNVSSNVLVSNDGSSSTPNRASVNAPTPASFYFRINQIPIFMRGANLIPLDSIEARVSPADRMYLLHAAAEANYNMIRVWGGGIYQQDDLYEAADEMGMLMWQEVMLACALYPRDTTFLRDIAIEVQQQAIRLGSHASVVTWGGNNENEVALGWFEPSYTNPYLYVADYAKLYADTIYPALLSVDQSISHPVSKDDAISSVKTTSETPRLQRAWVDSSPSNGLKSWDPYVKLWQQASTAAAGDVHFYSYSCDCEDPASFPAAQFISEFGFQSMPSFQAYKPVSDPTDWTVNSDLMLYRQRHEDGNSQIEAQIAKHFRLPDSSVETQKSFDDYLFLTGIQQGRCYETAITTWRSQRPSIVAAESDDDTTSSRIGKVSGPGAMGILYWQLNDIWQGPSWSSVEWDGRWKPLHYAVRRAYNPLAVAVSSKVVATNRVVSAYVINDSPMDEIVTVNVYLQQWASTQANDAVLLGTVSGLSSVAGSSILAVQLNMPASDDGMLARYGITVSQGYLKATIASSTSSAFYPHYAWLTPIKDAQLVSSSDFKIDIVAPPTQVADNVFAVTISSSVTAPFVWLDLDLGSDYFADNFNRDNSPGARGISTVAGWFSDNNFVAEAGVAYELTYTAFHSNSTEYPTLTLTQFASALRVRALQSLYL